MPEPEISFRGPDLSPIERAVHERMLLGLDVRHHLMAFERERIAAKGGLTVAQVSALTHGVQAFVVGNPIRLRFPPTKSGRRVLFFDLEDETGLLNVTCFDETYQRDGHAVVTCPYVTVFGEAQIRDGHTAFLATRVFPYRPRLDSVVSDQGEIPIEAADFLMR